MTVDADGTDARSFEIAAHELDCDRGKLRSRGLRLKRLRSTGQGFEASRRFAERDRGRVYRHRVVAAGETFDDDPSDWGGLFEHRVTVRSDRGRVLERCSYDVGWIASP